MRPTFVVLLSAVLLAACQPNAAQQPITPPHPFHGSDVHQEGIGGDFTLTNAQGEMFQLNHLQGKVVLLAFGFTQCPDICPTELLSYREAIQQLDTQQAQKTAVVFVSIDPERDTPEVMRPYLAQFHPDFIGLTATHGQDLRRIQQQYRIVARKNHIRSETSYTMDHSSGAYLLDKQGNVRVFEPYGSPAAHIAQDIQALLNNE